MATDSNGLSLFGFNITKSKNKDVESKSFVPATNIEGGLEVAAGSGAGFNSYSVDLDPSSIKNEVELVSKYREISLVSDIDLAISEIVDEFMVIDENEELVSIDFDQEFDEKYSKKTKEAITDEFKNILLLLKFQSIGPDIARNWYIDGRLAYHKIIDKDKTKDGIKELRSIDVAKLKRIIEIKKEIDPKTGISLVTGQSDYYIYTDKQKNSGIAGQGDQKQGIKIAPESIAYITSGLIDRNSNMVISYLHKAIRPLNQLRMMEDSDVIYRLTRAPQRRIFYIDTSGMARTKAEQYIKDVMARYKNKQVYDVNTGTVKDAKAHQSILEDFFLPRTTGGKGTEITTLDGAGCLAMDTKVKLLDGRDLSISKIRDEMESGKILWTYSCHPETGEIEPGLISWAGVTQKSAKVMKLTFDNGESLICTPDHKFPIYNKGFVDAKDLELNESMIPVYTKNTKISEFKKLDYTQVFDNASKEWVYTHRLVAHALKDLYVEDYVFNEENKNIKKSIIHHKDFNRYNNSPENLCFMSWKDHQQLHTKFSFSKEACILGGKAAAAKLIHQKEFEPEVYAKHIKQMSLKLKEWKASLSTEEYNDYCNSVSVGLMEYISSLNAEDRNTRDNQSIDNFMKGNSKFLELLKDPIYYEEWNSKNIASWNNEERRKLASDRAIENNSSMWNNEGHRENYKKKQKAELSDVILKGIIDLVKGKTTHQMTIEEVVVLLNQDEYLVNEFTEINKNKTSKFNKTQFTTSVLRKGIRKFGYKDWHDFRKKCVLHNHRLVKIEYLDEPIEVGTLTIDGTEMIHNYHTFALSCGVFTKNSLGSIENTEYFQQKLYQSLNIPLSRLQQGQGSFNIGRGNEITRDEIKFAKFISKLRLRFNNLFFDLLKTQLLLKGITTLEDWVLIKESMRFRYAKDNFFAELKESDMLRERLQNVQIADVYSGKYFSKEYIMRNMLKLSSEETDTMVEQMDKEAEEQAKIAADNPEPNPQQAQQQ